MTTILELFRPPHSMDTMQISERLGIAEAEVERELHLLRSAEKADTSQQEYDDIRMAVAERKRAYNKKRDRKRRSTSLRLIGYAGREDGREALA